MPQVRDRDDPILHIAHHASIIGEIAIVTHQGDVPEEWREAIVSAVRSSHPGVRAVMARVSGAPRQDRVPVYEFLAGDCATTIHREFGYRYRLDLEKVFFTPRLGSERMRIREMVREGEDILVGYAGVGPFAIPCADNGGEVRAVEKNRDACRFLRTNAKMNRVGDRIEVIAADLHDLPLKPSFLVDRMILPLPYGEVQPGGNLVQMVRPGGMIHLYPIQPREGIPPLVRSWEAGGLEVRKVRRCGHLAPGISRWAIDVVKMQ